MPIDSQASTVAARIADFLDATPVTPQMLTVGHRQLRNAGSAAQSETVVESVYRCLLLDQLQRRFGLTDTELPHCVNSSHMAPRTVCVTVPPHPHATIPPPSWEKAWQQMRKAVDIYVPGTAAKDILRRADLYVMTRDGIVSLEFKYVGPGGIRDGRGCAAQMRRYVEHHAATLLVLYVEAATHGDIGGLSALRKLLDPGVHLVLIRGATVPNT